MVYAEARTQFNTGLVEWPIAIQARISYDTSDEVTGVDVPDEEMFAPFLSVTRVASFDAAIEAANATRYGLAASPFTHDGAAIDRFRHEARAGCININCGTAGASSKLPFGGLGLSGNHRPAGAFSLDYTVMPIAGMDERGPTATIAEGMQFDDGWLR